jgi:hypothetical protein
MKNVIQGGGFSFETGTYQRGVTPFISRMQSRRGSDLKSIVVPYSALKWMIPMNYR